MFATHQHLVSHTRRCARAGFIQRDDGVEIGIMLVDMLQVRLNDRHRRDLPRPDSSGSGSIGKNHGNTTSASTGR